MYKETRVQIEDKIRKHLRLINAQSFLHRQSKCKDNKFWRSSPMLIFKSSYHLIKNEKISLSENIYIENIRGPQEENESST